MTVIHVMTPQGRLNVDQRRVLAKTLTDAVLVPEVGKLAPEARRGYQVHFAERPLDMVAHGGELQIVVTCAGAAEWRTTRLLPAS